MNRTATQPAGQPAAMSDRQPTSGAASRVYVLKTPVLAKVMGLVDDLIELGYVTADVIPPLDMESKHVRHGRLVNGVQHGGDVATITRYGPVMEIVVLTGRAEDGSVVPPDLAAALQPLAPNVIELPGAERGAGMQKRRGRFPSGVSPIRRGHAIKYRRALRQQQIAEYRETVAYHLQCADAHCSEIQQLVEG